MKSMPLSILAVPAFDDNYLWIVHNGRDAIVIDPGDGEVITRRLQELSLNLVAILITHHHADHIGGVAFLRTLFKVPVFGPDDARITELTQRLPLSEHPQAISIDELNLSLEVLSVPGHTLRHVAYYNKEHAMLFCGDTLFAGGCGRIFEGTAAQMHASLHKLAALPDETSVYCAHEYTLSNLQFALAVDPENPKLKRRFELVQQQRQQGLATVPSTIAIERETNPFLRSSETKIRQELIRLQKIAEAADDIAVFAAIREWKNHFRA